MGCEDDQHFHLWAAMSCFPVLFLEAGRTKIHLQRRKCATLHHPITVAHGEDALRSSHEAFCLHRLGYEESMMKKEPKLFEV